MSLRCLVLIAAFTLVSGSVAGWSAPAAMKVRSAAAKSKKLDCTKPKKKDVEFCKTIVDPMKFEKGEISVTDCTGELQDGYDAGICQNIDREQQAMLKKQIGE